MGPEHAPGAPPHDQRRRAARSAARCRSRWRRGWPSRRRRSSPCSATAPSASISPSSKPRCGATCRSSRCSATMRCWNAESQIQLREYGRERQHGCELTPARYDLVVAALGGHGELVEQRGRSAGRDRARARKRQAGLHQRHDREHRGAGDTAIAARPSGRDPLGAARIAQSRAAAASVERALRHIARGLRFGDTPTGMRVQARGFLRTSWGLDRAADTIDCRGSPPGAVRR